MGARAPYFSVPFTHKGVLNFAPLTRIDLAVPQGYPEIVINQPWALRFNDFNAYVPPSPCHRTVTFSRVSLLKYPYDGLNKHRCDSRKYILLIAGLSDVIFTVVYTTQRSAAIVLDARWNVAHCVENDARGTHVNFAESVRPFFSVSAFAMSDGCAVHARQSNIVGKTGNRQFLLRCLRPDINR